MPYTSKDLLLQAILQVDRLIKFGEYNPDEYLTVDSAIESDNEIVSAIGLIIERCSSKTDTREIYKEICNHLR